MPGQGQPPDDAEEAPAPAAAQVDQDERRIGAGDEQVNGRVVDDAADMLDPLAAAAVVERGTGEQQDQGGAVDAAADDVPGVAVPGGHDHQHGQPAQAEHGAQPVGQGVDRFFLEHETSLTAGGFPP